MPNTRAVFGAVLEQGESQVVNKINLGTGQRMLLGAGDSNALDPEFR